MFFFKLIITGSIVSSTRYFFFRESDDAIDTLAALVDVSVLPGLPKTEIILITNNRDDNHYLIEMFVPEIIFSSAVFSLSPDKDVFETLIILFLELDLIFVIILLVLNKSKI